MKSSLFNHTKLTAVVFGAIGIICASQVSYAKSQPNAGEPAAPAPAFSYMQAENSHWYVGANLGVSHLHDDPNAGTGNSVDENGPGGSVLAGYQFNRMIGAELGYTSYYNSRETVNPFVIAQTSHFAVDLAGTFQYPMAPRWNALAKLGAAYGYARKEASATGFSKSAHAVSPYWGLGVVYNLTQSVDVVAQFAEVTGNHLTGSTDLWSLGFNFAIS